MIAEPDAWDECAACGHDRDDHAGQCMFLLDTVTRRLCPCRAFEAAA